VHLDHFRFADDTPRTCAARIAVRDAERCSGLGRVEGNEALGTLWITRAGIAGQDRVGEDRPRALYIAVAQFASDQFVGRLALLHPIFERRHGVKLGETGTSAAVVNSRYEK
jgi:hypothetical protein